MAVGKKLLSAFFSFTLVMGLLPYSAFADSLDSNSDSTKSSSDASTSNESEFADGGVASKPDPSDSEGGMDSNDSVSGGEDVGFGVDGDFADEQELSAPDYSDGKLAIWADGLDDPSDVTDVYPPDTNEIEAYANGSNLQPMSFSSEMLYFCKYESSCNYDQGLSSGDGYHAMGYFQFDNRYGLGSFLKAAYNYNPSTYSALKVIGDRYGWDVTGATRSNGAFTQLGNDLNTAWHAAYKANPTEFSNLQNGWAYIDSYNGSLGARGCLKAFGINLDNRPDCIKGLCWGMVNLFGAGGGASYIYNGNYYGANWFFKNSGINDSMSDEAFVTTLCDYVVNNVAKRYPKQSIYWTGWQNRYKSEKADCLRYIRSNIYPIEDNFVSINKAPNSVSDGQYLFKSELDGMGVLQVGSNGSASETSLKICSSTMGEEQKFALERDSGSGYVRIKSMQSARYLGLVGSNGRYSQAVVQKEYSVDDKTLLWQIVESGGALVFKPAINTGYCLDVTGGSFYEGASVSLYKVNGGANQRFSLVSTAAPEVEGGRTVDDGVYSVSLGSDGSVALGVSGSATGDGGNVQATASGGLASQKFRFTMKEDGFYEVRNLNSGKVLDVDHGNIVPGTNILQWSDYASDNQRWAVQRCEGGYRLVCKANGLALTLGASAGPGSNAFASTVADGQGQVFSLEPAALERVVSDGEYVVSSQVDPMQVFDIAGASTANCARLEVYESHMADNQIFRFERDDDTGFYKVTCVGSGKVLDNDNRNVSNGAAVLQYDSTGALNQRWIVQREGSGLSIRSAIDPSYCIDLAGGGASNCTKAEMYRYNGGANQRFSLVSTAAPEVEGGRTVDDGVYSVSLGSDGSVALGVSGSATGDGGNVQATASGGLASQKFRFTMKEDGFYEVRNLNSGKVLDVDHGNIVPGTNILQWSDYASDNQRWAVQRCEGGYRLVCKANGLALTLGASAGPGSNAFASTVADGQGQVFSLEPAALERVVSDGEYVVSSQVDPMQVFDIAGASTANCARLEVYESHMADNQIFRFERDDDTGFYKVTCVGSGKVLDNDNRNVSNGAAVLQYDSTGALNQRWIVQREGSGLSIRSAIDPSYCIDLAGGGASNCTKAEMYRYNGGANQRFSLVSTDIAPVSESEDFGFEGWYEISPVADPSLCVDIFNASSDNGAKSLLYNKNSNLNQLFKLEYQNGFYRLVSASSGKALELKDGSVIPGVPAQQKTISDSMSQKWKITKNQDGSYSFVCAANGLMLGSAEVGSDVALSGRDGGAGENTSFCLTKRTDLLKEGVFKIAYGKDRGKVVDIDNASRADGANALIYSSNSNLNQKWKVKLVSGMENAYTFESLCSGKYLSVSGSNVVQSSFSDGSGEQMWTPVDIDAGAVVLQNVATGKILDVEGGASSNGTNVQVYERNNSSAQKFVFESTELVKTATYVFHSGASYGQVIDLNNASTQDGATVTTWTSNNGGNQKWNLSGNGDGTYHISNAANGKVLDVSGGTVIDGARVVQYSWHNGLNQKWYVVYDKEGGFVFESAQNRDVVLAVGSSAPSDGTSVCVEKKTGAANQRFCLEQTVYTPPMPSDRQAMQNRIWGYGSGTQWLIGVDRSTHRVGVFRGSTNNWTLQYWWSCVTGAPSTPTITGYYRTTGGKRMSLSTDSRAKWCTQIWNGYFFHTILNSDAELGNSLSHGCLRMSYPSAQWIYNNIYAGTTVVIYN